MAILENLKSGTGIYAKPIELDGNDVLAVREVGCAKPFADGSHGHRREVLTQEGKLTVYEMSKGAAVPPSIAALDKLCGKAFIAVAKVSSHGTSHASDLATAGSIIISVDPDDLIHVTCNELHSSSSVAGTGLSGAFTKSMKPVSLPNDTKIYYADLNIGDTRVSVATVQDGILEKFADYIPA